MDPTQTTQTQAAESGPWDEYKATQPLPPSGSPSTTERGPWDDFRQEAPAPVYAERPKDTKIDPDTLQYDKDFLAASRVLYNKENPQKPFTGSDKALSEWGLEKIYWFDNNFALGTVVDAARLQGADKEEVAAFMHVWDTYESLQRSWGGAWRTTKDMAQDPSNYLNLAGIVSTLIPGVNTVSGPATAASIAGRVMTKEGLKLLLKQSLKTGVMAGVEGGVFAAADNVAKQSVLVTAGRQEGISAGDAAVAGAVGTVAGTVLGTGLAAGLTANSARKLGKEAAQAVPANKAGSVAGEANIKPAGSVEAPREPLTPDQLANKVDIPNTKPEPPQIRASIEEAPRTGTTAQDVIAAVRSIAPDFAETGAVRLTRDQVVAAAKDAADVIQRLGIREADDVTPAFNSIGMSRDEWSIITIATKDAFQETGKVTKDLINQLAKATDEPTKDTLQKQIDELNAIREALRPLEMSLSSNSGSDLAARQGGIFTRENRGLTVDEILRERGFNDPSLAPRAEREAAQIEFNRRIDAVEERVAKNEQMTAIKQEIQQAAESGEFATVVAKVSEMKSLAAKIAEEEAKKAGIFGDAYDKFNRSVLSKVNEYVISTVFTPSTVIVNLLPALLKTMYKPFVNYLVKGPLDQAAFREMTATYSTMYAFKGSALEAAKAAFKYERSLLTGDPNKLLEGGPAIEGLKGRVLRTFPRLLSASDEFFAQINYRAFVVGDATSNAYVKGVQDGLKGKKLDAFVKDQVDKAVSNAYSAKLDTVNIVTFLRDRGMDRGLAGDALNQWVKTEFEKNKSLFRQAVNESGKNYADDLLFKREFSGSNQASRVALGYERFVNNNPIMRLAGQLFFRTPVRVFEEGFRLTPGLNLITPNFMADLTGKNGPAKQVRAQGEAMLSYSIGASVLAMYANGAITGGGPTDWKQRRGLENSKQYEPYTFVFKDGSTFSFRNLDPFATPLKILVNALDRYAMLDYRRRQGEYVNNEEKEVLAWVGVGVGSIAQAIRDASLAAGIDQIMSFAEAIGDPELNETKLTKLLGQKAQLAVPNLLTKTEQQFNPILTDPQSVEQYFRTRINPADPKVPKRYDSIGNVVTIANPESAFSGINYTSKADKDAALPPKTQEVLRELSNIEIATGSSFQAPYKIPKTGDLDLRSAMTQDGKETLYDRWNRYVRETSIVDDLHGAIVGSDMSYGSKSKDGIRIKVARDIISSYRDAAFWRLLSEETKIEQRYLQEIMGKADALSGAKDVSSMPFKTR